MSEGIAMCAARYGTRTGCRPSVYDEAVPVPNAKAYASIGRPYAVMVCYCTNGIGSYFKLDSSVADIVKV